MRGLRGKGSPRVPARLGSCRRPPSEGDHGYGSSQPALHPSSLSIGMQPQGSDMDAWPHCSRRAMEGEPPGRMRRKPVRLSDRFATQGHVRRKPVRPVRSPGPPRTAETCPTGPEDSAAGAETCPTVGQARRLAPQVAKTCPTVGQVRSPGARVPQTCPTVGQARWLAPQVAKACPTAQRPDAFAGSCPRLRRPIRLSDTFVVPRLFDGRSPVRLSDTFVAPGFRLRKPVRLSDRFLDSAPGRRALSVTPPSRLRLHLVAGCGCRPWLHLCFQADRAIGDHHGLGTDLMRVPVQHTARLVAGLRVALVLVVGFQSEWRG